MVEVADVVDAVDVDSVVVVVVLLLDLVTGVAVVVAVVTQQFPPTWLIYHLAHLAVAAANYVQLFFGSLSYSRNHNEPSGWNLPYCTSSVIKIRSMMNADSY